MAMPCNQPVKITPARKEKCQLKGCVFSQEFLWKFHFNNSTLLDAEAHGERCWMLK